MARRAIRDTFGIEPIYGNEVRRFVKAGTIVPDHYTQVPEEDVAQDLAYNPPILVATPPPPPEEPQLLESEQTSSRRTKK